MMRACPGCGTFNEFSADHSVKRGYRCKPCTSRASVESARLNRERKRANNNAYSARHSGKRAERTAAYRARHPEKRLAHQAVQSALRSGVLQRRPCLVCSCTKAVAHHDDYSKPLEVLWLCHVHHMERHAMLRARQATTGAAS